MAALGYGPDCEGDIGWLSLGWVDYGKGGGWKRIPSSCTRNATSQSYPGASYPGARSGAAWWQVGPQHWFLFGGYGTGAHAAPFEGKLADAWHFDASSLTWSFAGGPTSIESVANYSTQPVWPGSRVGGVPWQDAEGNFYLVLGWGLADVPGKRGGLSDVWRLQFDHKGHPKWSFEGGPKTVNNLGSNNSISGRYGVTHWSKGGCLYVYGGHGIDSDGKDSFLSSLYSFCPSVGWKLLHGSLAGNLPPSYGSIGEYSTDNSPGSRYGAVPLPLDSASNVLFMFGGSGAYSDIWGFDIKLNAWAWLGGPKGLGFLNGNSSWPSGRRDCTIFPMNDTHVTIASGYGYGPHNSTTQGGLSDVWVLSFGP